jgi:preprotein translocase subunit SecA
MISRAIENAQRKVEGYHFEVRKHLLEYDDVMNKQREVIYRQRREVLARENVRSIVDDMIADLVAGVVAGYASDKKASPDWDWDGMAERLQELFNIRLSWSEEARSNLNGDRLTEKLYELVQEAYNHQVEENGADQMRQLERLILLQVVDGHWKEHLLNMDHLKEGIGLRGYGQKNPLNEFKREGFDLFATMVETVKEQVVGTLLRVRVVKSDEVAQMEEEQRRKRQEMELNRGAAGLDEGGERKPVKRADDKVGRNAPCPCGSGLKYKKCCGSL